VGRGVGAALAALVHASACHQASMHDRFCTRLEEVARKAVGDEEARARPIAIASEAGKFSSTLMHNRPVPTTRLRRELERCFRMVLDDEHRASSFQFGTATRQRDIYRMSDGRYVRGIQWCDATTTFSCMPFTRTVTQMRLVPAQWRRPLAAPEAWPPQAERGAHSVDPAVTLLLHVSGVDALEQALGQPILPAGHKHTGGRPGSTRRGAANGRVRPCTLR
jgi:hypothetical protein